MNTAVSLQVDQLLLSAGIEPAISIFLPFEPGMDSKQEISQRFNRLVDKVVLSLRKTADYPFSKLVLRKLDNLIGNLNYSSFCRSLAIYMSPVFEKVFYLDIEVQESVIVNGSFDIRDIIYAKKEDHRFLVLSLGEAQNSVWLFNGISMSKIQSGNVSDQPSGDRASDKVLSTLLKHYPYPLIVTGIENRLDHYKLHSFLPAPVIRHITVKHEPFTAQQVMELTEPVRRNWSMIHRRDIFSRIAMAASGNCLVTGAEQCLEKAGRSARQLLVLEKNLVAAVPHGMDESFNSGYDPFSCVKDAIDMMIEKVLANGGDVEFLEDDALLHYGRVLLINRP